MLPQGEICQWKLLVCVFFVAQMQTLLRVCVNRILFLSRSWQRQNVDLYHIFDKLTKGILKLQVQGIKPR